MTLTFSALDLNFEAEVSYGKRFSGTREDPPENAEARILSLTAEGSDALFLLNSKIMREAIYDVVDSLAYEP